VPFRIAGIPSDLAEAVRQTLKSPQYGHPAHRETATGYGPCRLCLRTFEVGAEERLLFTYQPFSDPSSVSAPVRSSSMLPPGERYEGSTLPPDFRSLPLLLEGYGSGGELLGREQAPDTVIERLFVRLGAAYVHIRNAESPVLPGRSSGQLADQPSDRARRTQTGALAPRPDQAAPRRPRVPSTSAGPAASPKCAPGNPALQGHRWAGRAQGGRQGPGSTPRW
jgi:hypothetical protein